VTAAIDENDSSNDNTRAARKLGPPVSFQTP
jgi:hypothetical protein